MPKKYTGPSAIRTAIFRTLAGISSLLMAWVTYASPISLWIILHLWGIYFFGSFAVFGYDFPEIWRNFTVRTISRIKNIFNT